MVKTVEISTLKKWLENDEVFLIDVREVDEYNESNIKEAVLMPLATVNLEEIKKQNTENKKIAIHCRSGKRSMNACNTLLIQDPSLELYNVEGGILAYNESNK
jgi:rhodanese-related sulfurtransferase